MATKRRGSLFRISNIPPNLESIGTPDFSSTPLTIALQTVAKPTCHPGWTGRLCHRLQCDRQWRAAEVGCADGLQVRWDIGDAKQGAPALRGHNQLCRH